jgi:hypothetical protein
MIKFVEVISEINFNAPVEARPPSPFSLEEVWLNENMVIKIQNAPEYKRLLEEGHLGPALNPDHAFTSVTINNCGVMETHVVMGTLSVTAARLNLANPTLLKG